NCKADSPDDVVLLFETKGGWNQHGGMELMDFEHHLGAVCNVLLNDGSVLYIQPTTMRLLNWGDKDGEQKAESGEQDTDGTTEEFAVNLKVGDDAPGFSLLAQDGETVSLSDCAGSKVLVYFYPKADTPGCTKQACSVRDSTEELKKAGVVVLGISPDEPNEQQKFDEKYSLGFRLLSDSEHKAAEAYSVWGEKNMYGKKFMGIIRSSFLIDENGKLIGVWYNVKPEETVPKAMAVVSR
ncbi:MAG: thioredoxin-dependent thiol peroxidase, partial [Phycisphaerae bacterium]